MSQSDRLNTMALLGVIFGLATIFAGMAYDSNCVGITIALCVIALACVVGVAVLWMVGKVFLS